MYALGGSTNAVLHILALAHEAEIELVIDDFNRWGLCSPPSISAFCPIQRCAHETVARSLAIALDFVLHATASVTTPRW
eukprot:COSAG05_NODE_969_length_6392_cov_59.426506_4_plen_79_part_00